MSSTHMTTSPQPNDEELDAAVNALTTVDGLTLEERVALGSGASFWATKSAPGVAAVVLTDGPHGVRRQLGAEDHLGIAESEPATCFPPAVSLGQSWDPELVGRVGRALGVEARALGVGVLLGPGINIKRDPRGGRNFEYLSEDPHLTGELGLAWVHGLQSAGVGASVKHFAANNAETDRMRSSSDVDIRTLREIYLRGFERVIRAGRPWTVMCSYNRINGVHAAENRWLLHDVLRSEWDYQGVVVSDWGAVRDRTKSIAAGLDLEMPGGSTASDRAIVQAVTDGALDEQAVTTAAERIVALSRKVHATDAQTPISAPDHHELAREAARRAIVLLRNERDLLPLSADATIAVVGEFARTPRYQGGGSSHVRPTRLDIPLDEIRGALNAPVEFEPGYRIAPATAAESEDLRVAAVAAARRADVAVMFLGLPESEESEGFDRDHIDLPGAQQQLVHEVLAAQPNTVVVLAHGGVLDLTPLSAVPAIVDGGLLGQGGGRALADVLTGAVNPSARLAETIPHRLQDVPSFGSFPGELSHVRYAEGLFVGYRWYDSRNAQVAYPFGHGLSYTSFTYSDLHVDRTDDGALRLSLQVANTGPRDGREVVQVYVSTPTSTVTRPAQELQAFVPVDLTAGASSRVELTVPRTAFAHWDVPTDQWRVEGGDRVLRIGASSRDIRLEHRTHIDGDLWPTVYTEDSTLGEVMANPRAAQLLGQMMGMTQVQSGEDNPLGTDMARMAASFPLGRLRAFAGDQFDDQALRGLLSALNT